MVRFYLLICLETENCCEIIIYGPLLPCGELLCPFPFLFFFYSKTIYLATPKNVLLSVLFLLLDPIYSFTKTSPSLKLFLYLQNFFSKLFSSQKFLPPWLLAMNGKIPISWIFLGQFQSHIPLPASKFACYFGNYKSEIFKIFHNFQNLQKILRFWIFSRNFQNHRGTVTDIKGADASFLVNSKMSISIARGI